MPFGAITAGIGLIRDSRNRRSASRAVKLGHQYDVEYSLEKEAALYDRARERGLTPQEYYGSAAPGAPGVSGGSQVLGNASTQGGMQVSGLIAEAAQKAADRNVLKRGQDTQKEVAGIQADAQIKTAEIQEGVQRDQLGQTVREYEEVTLPQAAAKLKLSEAELKVRLNEIATSAPDFVKEKILLQMGVENTIQTAILKRFRVDPTKAETVRNLTDEQFEALMAELFAAGSYLNREISGAGSQINKMLRNLMTEQKKEPERKRKKQYQSPFNQTPNKNWIPGVGAPG